MPSTPPTADDPTQPGATPEQPADDAAAPPRVARLLTLLHWLIATGIRHAASLPQRALGPGFVERFPNLTLDALQVRIKRGLMLAAALEARLAERAARGRDVVPTPVRFSMPRRPAAAVRRPRAPRATCIVDLPLDRLPTAMEIAAELRRRPIGAILADICRDLALMPGDLSRAEWQELVDAITNYGGNLATWLFKERHDEVRQKLAARGWNGRRFVAPGAPAKRPADVAAAAAAPATGPPPMQAAVA